MLLTLSDEQVAFRDATRRFLENEAPLAAVRDLYDDPDGFSRSWWSKAAGLGWTSLFVPETYGGGTLSGFATADASIVAHEMGRLVSPGPFLSVNVVAAALAATGSDELQGSVLPGLATGALVASWAFAEPGDRWDPGRIETTAAPEAGGVVVTGEKAYVEAGAVADHFLVTAAGDGGLTQVLVPADAPGVTIVRGRSMDFTRRFARVRFDRVRVPAGAVVGEPGGARDAVDHQLALALALQCAELTGAAERTFATTIEYGRDRVAFGRPIVSFQALKHRLADMAVWLEGMKAVAEELVRRVDAAPAPGARPAPADASDPARASDPADADPPADPSELARLASAAKIYVGTHALDIVDDCVQITGGLGVTWEHDIHLYNRRVVVDRAIFGTPEQHRRRLMNLLTQQGSSS